MDTMGFHSANQICKSMEEVKQDINEIKETQSTIVSSITDNESAFNQYAYQMSLPPPSPYHQHHQPPTHNGCYSFVPPALIPPSASSNTNTTAPSHKQANMSATNLHPELKNFMKSMKSEIATLKQQFSTPAVAL